jgi:uncharacterized protein HemY
MTYRTLAILFLLASYTSAQPDAFVKGLDAFHKGDYPAAEKLLRASSDPRAKAFLALTLAATNRCPQAEPDLTAAFAAAKSDTQRLAGLALAQCHIAASRWDDASAVVLKFKAG